MAAAVTIEIGVDEGVAFLTATGDLDMASADEFRQAGERALTDFTGTLRINLAQVPFIDSTGIGALVAIHNKADDTRHVLILEQPSARVLRTLTIAGMTEVFTLA